MFEPIETATEDRLLPTKDGFYLLNLDSLLSEKCQFIYPRVPEQISIYFPKARSWLVFVISLQSLILS